MGTDLKTERGVYLTPEFEEAEHRIGDNALKWVLRFVQTPLPKEKSVEWGNLLRELMLLAHFWNHKSPIHWVCEKQWEGISDIANFQAENPESPSLRWRKVHLPPTRDVEQIQKTLLTWLHELLHSEYVTITVPNISKISFTISRPKNTSRNLSGRHPRFYIDGGYKEHFLLTAARSIEENAQSLRYCPYKNCSMPIFLAKDKRMKACSAAHAGNIRSKIFYNKPRGKAPHWVIEGGDHEKQLKEVHAHLSFGDPLPAKQKVDSRKKVLSKKKAGK